MTNSIHLLVVLFLCVLSNAIKIKSNDLKSHDSEPGQFPFYAFLKIETKSYESFRCGGTLISDKWIITAGHCLVRAKSIDIMLGASNLTDLSEPDRDQFRLDKRSIFVHPFYFPTFVLNDIGLIQLPRPAKLSNRVRPINLPTSCDSLENIDVIALGNGVPNEDSPAMQFLQFADMKTIPSNQCTKQFKILLWRKSVICANSDAGNSICDGDSGGPLVRKSDNVLIGVSSMIDGNGCENGKPQGFTNFFRYFDWISHRTKIDLPQC